MEPQIDRFVSSPLLAHHQRTNKEKTLRKQQQPEIHKKNHNKTIRQMKQDFNQGLRYIHIQKGVGLLDFYSSLHIFLV